MSLTFVNYLVGDVVVGCLCEDTEDLVVWHVPTLDMVVINESSFKTARAVFDSWNWAMEAIEAI